MDLETREERRLTDEQEIVTEGSGFWWSSSARRFVYAVGREETAFYYATDIYTTDIDGQIKERLTEDELQEFSPSWSPD